MLYLLNTGHTNAATMSMKLTTTVCVDIVECKIAVME